MNFVSISEYSRVTAPSTKDITAPITPKESESWMIQKPKTPAQSSGLSYGAISKLSFLQTGKANMQPSVTTYNSSVMSTKRHQTPVASSRQDAMSVLSAKSGLKSREK